MAAFVTSYIDQIANFGTIHEHTYICPALISDESAGFSGARRLCVCVCVFVCVCVCNLIRSEAINSRNFKPWIIM